MSRNAIRPSVQSEVLLLCRRRCCICFGLDRNTDIRAGQIAHLDRDSGNNRPDNLAFLCLEHHDEYDSRTSQRKGLLPQEIRAFRKELHEAVLQWASQPATFAPARSTVRGLEGRYVRQGLYDEAELQVQRLDDGRLHVIGFAVWGTSRPFGPNTGELDFVAPLAEGNSLALTEPTSSGDYQLSLQFADGQLVAAEDYTIGRFGMNVTFEGIYEKMAPASSSFER
jgi:hypothetical protein